MFGPCEDNLTDRRFYRVADGHGLPHDPFKAIVGPRPIGWISSRSLAGVANLAPFSFFNALSSNPPIIGFSSDGWKDTVQNISETREFGWNLATASLARAMNESSATVPPEVDEFDLAGLRPTEGLVTKAPLVAEAPVSFECKLSEIVRVKDHQGAASPNWLVIGEVVGVHIDPAFLVDGLYDTAAAAPILRGGGPGDYFNVGPDQKFVMFRPKTPA